MDPQQRLILECAAEALSLSSNGSTSKGAVGAYVGVASSDYGSVVKAHTKVNNSAAGTYVAHAGKYWLNHEFKGQIEILLLRCGRD